MKIIRWWGLLVFVVMMSVIIALYWYFAEWLIKRAIEESGSALFGAKVEVDRVELALRDGRLQLFRIQIANAAAPMQNLIEIENMTGDLDTAQLLWKRVHIEKMAWEGITFGTARQTSGAIEQQSNTGASVLHSLLPELTQFDWKTLDNREGWQALFDNLQLESLHSVEQVRTQLRQAESDIKTKINALPDKAKLAAYEAKIKALTSKLEGDKLTRALQLAQRGKELDAVRKELKAELAKVKAVKQQYETSRAALKTAYQQAKAAPDKDIEKVMSRLTVELPGTDQLISRVLGPELNTRLQQGQASYAMAEPWLNKARILAGQNPDAPPPPARFAGVDVHFELRDPQPDFWLKLAQLSGRVQFAGSDLSFDGQLQHVSDQPAMIAEPAQLNMTGTSGKSQSRLTAVVDRRGVHDHDALQFSLTALPVTQWPISRDTAFALTVEQAELFVEAQARRDAQQTRVNADARLQAMRLQGSSASDNEWVQAIVSEISKETQFGVQFLFEKNATQESRHFSSDLDNIAKRALDNVVQKKLAQKKAEVKQRLKERAAQELAKLESDWANLGALESVLGDSANQLDALIKKG